MPRGGLFGSNMVDSDQQLEIRLGEGQALTCLKVYEWLQGEDAGIIPLK